MAEPERAPGWYPDEGQLRYFDGRAWTVQRRPLPPWGRPGGDAPPPPKRRHWFVISLTVAAVIGTVITVLVMHSVGQRPARTIHDSSFERQADAICRSRLASIRPAPSDPEGPAPSIRADVMGRRIDRTADAIAETARLLRAVPVNAGDRAPVVAWLADWDRFATIGHRYADAVRAGDPRTYTKIQAEGNGPVHRIGRFARGNHIDHCVL